MTRCPVQTFERPEYERSFGWVLPEAPERIHVEGEEKALGLLARLPERGFAVVGTRDPQSRSLELARQWIRALAHRELIVISGLARGIDSVAHEAALEAGIPTIAVLGGGLGVRYPRENDSLRERIVKSGGLVISEFPHEQSPYPSFFLQRNRLIAAWAQATWVVEAPMRSGALNTAAWARNLHRTCFATPCFPGDPCFAGNQTLIDRDHAVPAWGPRSFGQVWLELATLGSSGAEAGALSATPASLASESARELAREILDRERSNQGASAHELLDWAIRLQWPPEKFFAALCEIERHCRLETSGGNIRVK